MRKILIGVALLVVGAVIVFGARKGLREHARAMPQAVGAVASARGDAPGQIGAAPTEVEGEIAGGAAPAGEAAEATEVSPPAGGGEESSTVTRPAPTPTAPARPAESATGDSKPREPSAQDPDLEVVLRRAAANYTKARSLQADFSQRSMNPILRTTVTSRGTLYQRRPDRFLMKFSEPAGDLIVSDGSHFWVYYPSVDRKQVIRMPASMGAGGVDLQAQFLGDPLERFAATYEGREDVAGRTAYVLVLEPRQQMGYRVLKVWVDAQDYLVRRFEVTEENGIVRHFELSKLRLDPTLADELFRFTPPEGTHVVDRG